MAQTVKNLLVVQETWVWLLGWKDSLEKEMATHSSILAWEIPWTGAWQVTICVILRVKCKLVTKAHTHHHLKTAHGLTSFILFCLAKYLTSFHVLVNHLYISSGEGSMQALYPFKKLVSLSFCWWVVKVLDIVWITDSHQMYNVQIFSSVLWAVFLLSG